MPGVKRINSSDDSPDSRPSSRRPRLVDYSDSEEDSVIEIESIDNDVYDQLVTMGFDGIRSQDASPREEEDSMDNDWLANYIRLHGSQFMAASSLREDSFNANDSLDDYVKNNDPQLTPPPVQEEEVDPDNSMQIDILDDEDRPLSPPASPARPEVRIVQIGRGERICNSAVWDTLTYEVSVNEDYVFNNGRDIDESFEVVIEEVLQHVLQDVDYVNFSVQIIFNFTRPDDQIHYVRLPYWRLRENLDNARHICSVLKESFQSGDRTSFVNFTFTVNIAHQVQGQGLFTPSKPVFSHNNITKRHLYDSDNTRTRQEDTTGCVFKAAIFCKKTITEGIACRSIHTSTLINEAEQLALKCGLPYDEPFTSDKFPILEEKLKCRLFVFSSLDENMSVIYKPQNKDMSLPLYIIGHDSDNHYYPLNVNNIKLCFKNLCDRKHTNHGFCDRCYQFFTDRQLHYRTECEYNRCQQCFHANCKGKGDDQPILECNSCFRLFINNQCYAYHKENNTCKRLKACEHCKDIVENNQFSQKQHDCQNIRCHTCYMKFDPTEGMHKCYMQKKKLTMKAKTIYTSVYYDIETMAMKRTDSRGNEITAMVPFLLVTQIICQACSSKEDTKEEDCTNCGPRTRIFKLTGPEESDCPVDKFINLLLTQYAGQPHKEVCVVAHNGSKFDNQFILARLLSRNDKDVFTTNPNKRGHKIISMKCYKNITFKDSLLYMPSSLQKLPKIMGLDIEGLAKGFFPYTFVTPDTLNYKGPIPEKHHFCYEKMPDKEAFDEFYQSYTDRDYDLMDEAVKYCTQDVVVLRRCFEKFRKNYSDPFKIDCLTHASTIASLCFNVYKSKFMAEKTIAHIGRDKCKHFSFAGLRWLTYMEEKEKHRIQHARNGGERVFKLENRLVYPDGYAEVTKEDGTVEKKVYNFQGCLYHGHPLCGKDATTYQGVSGIDRYNKTISQNALYERNGYKLIEVWECSWNKQMDSEKKTRGKNDVISLRTHVNAISKDIVNSKLIVEDGLFGGRNEPFALYMPPTHDKNYKIHYLDYTSLYPYVQKNKPYPKGVPRKLIGNEIPRIEEYVSKINEEYFGMAYVDVLPPEDLYIPVLPIRVDKKLYFPLCRTCTEKSQQTLCTHSRDERKIKGVYTSPELKLAIDKGYKILKIYEVWSFEKTYELFAEYIKTFLKWKTEASGLPAGIDSLEDPEMDEFIAEFERREGVKLDKEKIEKKPGMRFIAKLCLNSLWGKFAQRTPHTEDIICESLDDFWALFIKSEYEVQNVELVGQHHIATVKHTDMSKVSSKSTNVAIAAFTTAHARVKLYELLEHVGNNVLYCDTDSCIFITKSEEEERSIPSTGNFLGELTNELSEYGEGAYGSSYICTGPKSYSVQITLPSGEKKYIIKAKGLTINKDTEGVINFEKMVALSMKKMIDENDDDYDDVFYNHIKDTDITSLEIQRLVKENKVEIEEAVQVPNDRILAGQYGGVTLKKGFKIFRATADKRVVIPDTARTVPFGFRGRLLPL